MLLLLVFAVGSNLYFWEDGWSVRGCNADRCRSDTTFFEHRAECEAAVTWAKKNYPTLVFECVKVLRTKRIDVAP